MNSDNIDFLLNKVNENPKISASKLKELLNKEEHVAVSRQTIRNYLHSEDLHGRIARKVPLLSPKNINRRKELCNSWSSWTLKKWKKVLFSDETKINLFSSDGKVTVWRKLSTAFNSRNCVPTVKHGGGSLMVWGCFSYEGVGKLVFIDGIMDKYQYKRILAENLDKSCEMLGLPVDFIFQQDNDPKHKSKYVMEFFDNNDFSFMDWPSQSN